jgi:hypothetical protein
MTESILEKATKLHRKENFDVMVNESKFHAGEYWVGTTFNGDDWQCFSLTDEELIATRDKIDSFIKERSLESKKLPKSL